MVTQEDNAKLDMLPMLICGECGAYLQISTKARDWSVKYKIVCGCAPEHIIVRLAPAGAASTVKNALPD